MFLEASYLQLIGEAFEGLYFLLFHYRLKPSDIQLLEKHFPYYSRLKPQHQREFRKKLEMIISQKKFIPRGGMKEVSMEMKLMIGASIVQVTFGFWKVFLSHFKKILIYPDTYYSTISKQYHRGEVNPRFGMIVFSWSCFVNGFVDNQDGVNLGVHEVAHALKLENRIHYNQESNFLHPGVWRDFLKHSETEKENIHNGTDDFFRERGSVDEDEFFAVALENFFERPEDFKARKKELYHILVQLLRQDPITLKSA
ncbi:zinc-dependent peptidase [Algoriphagus sp. PAP.12]|uniref:zinc-dependent peptidase n=1 Tax=Algoriphagus sp. PAP.12 TaxID=2996678 RepID=UPI00227C503B|nr:zinc-dependent peptidase [Algoriphagus sp. PAP.12]